MQPHVLGSGDLMGARVLGELDVFHLEQLYAEILAERDGAPVQAALF